MDCDSKEMFKSRQLTATEDGNELDPRVQVELDKLNHASQDINKLENELDEARTKYRMTFAEASTKMTSLAKKSRKSIQRSREYYELKEQAKAAQAESLKAARQYQSAISIYRAAKETVALAEERLVQKGEVQLSSAWQEMLNHATMRVMEAETEKRRSEEQHLVMTSRCGDLDQRLKVIEKKYKRSIANARPYFETKQQLELRLQQLKQNVSDLQAAIKNAKRKYSATLNNLEAISEEIHEYRREKLMLLLPRQPGVGAECDSIGSSMSELNIDFPADGDLGEPCDTDDENEAETEHEASSSKNSIIASESSNKLEQSCDDTSSRTDISCELTREFKVKDENTDSDNDTCIAKPSECPDSSETVVNTDQEVVDNSDPCLPTPDTGLHGEV